ncbi:MAG: DUF302 domain-containing protein [Bacillota bacterium]
MNRDIDAEIAKAEADLTELRSRLPAHSLKPGMARELDDLEERVARLRGEKESSALQAVPEMSYTVTAGKAFDQAVQAVEAKTAEKGFRVLHVHDVQATLKEKGFEREPLKIVEVCNAKYANRVLTTDINVGLFLPCKINVYTKEGQTYISALRPMVLATFFPGSALGDVPAEVDQIVRDIVDAAR